MSYYRVRRIVVLDTAYSIETTELCNSELLLSSRFAPTPRLRNIIRRNHVYSYIA